MMNGKNPYDYNPFDPEPTEQNQQPIQLEKVQTEDIQSPQDEHCPQDGFNASQAPPDNSGVCRNLNPPNHQWGNPAGDANGGGFRNFGGYYVPPTPNQQKNKVGFAITAFILSLISVPFFVISPLFTVPSLIFAIISVANRRGAKGLAVTAIVISVVTSVLCVFFWRIYGDIFMDSIYFSMDTKAVEYYQETGELPDSLKKYTTEEYDDIWKAFNVDSYYGFLEKNFKIKSPYAVDNASRQKTEASQKQNLSFYRFRSYPLIQSEIYL